MKHILKSFAVFALAILLTNCGEKKETDAYGNPVEEKTEATTETTVDPLFAKGQELFEGKGACIACHKVDTKLIGPSLQDIAKTYKEKNGDLVAFLKEEAKPIMDPSQYDIMKANFAITKAMSDEELKGLEAYIYSNLK